MNVILNPLVKTRSIIVMVKILIMIAFLVGCGTHSARSTREPSASPEKKSAIGSYRVQAGDTLFALAWKNNTTVDKLQKLNGMTANSILRIGQNIRLASEVDKAVTAQATPQLSEPLKPCCIKKQPEFSQPIKKYEFGQWSSGWIWPIKGSIVSPYSAKGGLNKGIDIKSKLGESVVAASDGEVVFAGNELKGYPNLVIVKHGARYLSAYSNNHTLFVKEGDKVRKGQPIAQMGKAPGATRLHFEIRTDGKPIDPQLLLP
ncbi:MAG TPA: peptidoglycan DD-metalloendopeptidase family protein [Cellvibrionaceae bacterium]